MIFKGLSITSLSLSSDYFNFFSYFFQGRRFGFIRSESSKKCSKLLLWSFDHLDFY